jgi:hypothetical protein
MIMISNICGGQVSSCDIATCFLNIHTDRFISLFSVQQEERNYW